jgi:hypothetical protein
LIRANFDSVSNDMDESHSQYEKHDENAYDLVRVNSDSVSNEIDKIELEFEKQYV